MRVSGPPIKWGVIGFGDVVRRKSGPALLADPGAEVAAVTRATGDVMEAARALRCRPLPTPEMLAEDSAVEAIYIAAPPDAHEALVKAVLPAGKPIVVEKPIAHEAEAAKRMVSAAREAGVSLSVAYYRRVDPRLHRVRSLIRAGAVGPVTAVEVKQLRDDGAEPLSGWRANPAISPGGRFADSHIHAIDWLRHAFGAHEAVTGGERAATGRAPMIAYALKLKEAVAAGVFHSDARQPIDTLTVHGEDGRIITPFFEHGPIVVERDGGELRHEVPTPLFGHQPFFAAMGEHIRSGAPSPCPAAEAIGATEIVERLTLEARAAHVAAE